MRKYEKISDSVYFRATILNKIRENLVFWRYFCFFKNKTRSKDGCIPVTVSILHSLLQNQFFLVQKIFTFEFPMPLFRFAKNTFFEVDFLFKIVSRKYTESEILIDFLSFFSFFVIQPTSNQPPKKSRSFSQKTTTLSVKNTASEKS